MESRPELQKSDALVRVGFFGTWKQRVPWGFGEFLTAIMRLLSKQN